MIQEGINSLLTTAGRAYVAKVGADILRGKKEEEAAQSKLEAEQAAARKSFDEKIANVDVKIAKSGEKVANAQYKEEKALQTLKTTGTEKAYENWQKLKAASESVASLQAVRKTQLEAMRARIEAEKKKRGL